MKYPRTSLYGPGTGMTWSEYDRLVHQGGKSRITAAAIASLKAKFERIYR